MIYLFILLLPPTSPACVLWIDHIPAAADYAAACQYGAIPQDAELRLVSLAGEVICVTPLDPYACATTGLADYRIEVWGTNPVWACDVRTASPELTPGAVAAMCPEYLQQYLAGEMIVSGPFPVETPPQPVSVCSLPAVDNSGDLSTAADYEFLTRRLAWWGVQISPLDWQNRFDESIRGAADAAWIPARLLKAMIAAESQFWPLWTGDTGEVGWLQLTDAGADTALRYSEQLFDKYCPLAVDPSRCVRGYDLLAGWEQGHVRAVLLADLRVSGVPSQAADQASADLWTSAQVLRSFACWGRVLSPSGDVWQTAAVLYNAGGACLTPEGYCPAGVAYLEKVLP